MFGHYAVLGISRTATPEEIHTAYRRLAMIHHPDRNPNDTVGATARFQKIQQAYEVLSNSFERRRYDATQSTTFPPEVPHASSEHRYQRPNNTTFYTAHNHQYHLEGMIASLKHMYDQLQAQYGCHGGFELWRRQQELQEQLAFWEARLRRLEREARREQEAVRQKAAWDRETRWQRARWRWAGAVTAEQKFATCLHSAFCAEIGRRDNAKCDACGIKRSMRTFRCPHCARYLCRLCVANFTSRRARSM
ncbi:hypothetical protein ANO14919_119720 [Xylariales sp. No.14919]|nr:hypothetical protein ANO14919_119720 [Xylariales sp. No.14919]